MISCSSCISSGCSSALLLNEVILSAILFVIKSPTAGTAFSKICFPEVLANFKPSFFNALPYLLLSNLFAAAIPLLLFYHTYFQISLQMTKKP